HLEPRTMQNSPMEGQVSGQVRDFLQERVSAVRARGVSAERIALDPGIGFGKTVPQNFELLKNQADLVELGYPLLVGWSRKSSLAAVAPDGMLAATTGSHPRMLPSVVAAVLAAERGARILRVHDVAETVHALKILNAI
ncbi:MAG: dihydropteroate synthase, partial [Rhodoferax sp.]|nr:dihydropteroate synthase [Rhodoferax sp.]